MLTIGSLFSGIGGIELGLERTGGFETRWQCEIDGYARKVLAKNWPGLPIYPDVKDLYRTVFPERVDVLCGGFPCQDVSEAGQRKGMGEGTRSGLYNEFARIIGQAKPRWVIIENVRGLLSIDSGRGYGKVHYDLSQMGYVAWGGIIPASWFGAPHRRERIFIVAHSTGAPGKVARLFTNKKEGAVGNHIRLTMPIDWNGVQFDGSGTGFIEAWKKEHLGESILIGVNDGIPDWMDRNRCLGNAVVPQCAQYIGERILYYERELKTAG